MKANPPNVRGLTRLVSIKATQVERLRKRCPLVSASSTFFPNEAEALRLAEELGSTANHEQRNLERFERILKPCQERPQSLDSSLETLANSLIKRVGESPCASRALYLLCTIRGRKAVARTLPREVFRLEEALRLVDLECWETKYVGLVWLSILVLVPFAIDSIIDSDTPIREILSRCDRFLNDVKPTREPASLCLARLFARRDCNKELRAFLLRDDTGIGHLLTKAEIFKRGGTDLADLAKEILENVIESAERVFMSPKKYSSIERKLELKVLQRVYVASSQQIQQRRLLERIIGLFIGSGLSDCDSIVRWSAAKGIGRVCERVADENIRSQICESVISLFVEDDSAADDTTWHGASLALAELSRKRLLSNADQIHRALNECVARALEFDRKRGTRTLGSNVRDAACYVCWALVRSVPGELIAPHVETLYSDLVITSLFDREVSCRRAAAAALQECVGRLGRKRFLKGIETIQILDYQNIGNIQKSYQLYASQVAALGNSPSIVFDLCQHLVESKSAHWDEQIRQLASISLSTLCSLPNVDGWTYFDTFAKRINSTSNRLEIHGSLLACAELLTILEVASNDPKRFQVRDILRSSAVTVQSFTNFEDVQVAWCRFAEVAAGRGVVNPQDRREFVDEMVLNCLKTTATSTRRESSHALRNRARRALVACLIHVPIPEDISVLIPSACAANPPNVPVIHASIIAMRESMTSEFSRRILDAVGKVLRSNNCYLDRVECLQALAETSFPVKNLLSLILHSLDDYQATNQGDVGSWVRRQACFTACRVFIQTKRSVQNKLTSDCNLEGCFLQIRNKCAFLACEKLDHVREAGLRASMLFLDSSEIEKVVQRLDDDHGTYYQPDDESAAEAHGIRADFHRCEEMLADRSLRCSIIQGLALTAGSLSESPSEAAKSCLRHWCQNVADERGRMEMWDALLNAIRANGRIESRIVPLLKTVGSMLLDSAVPLLPASSTYTVTWATAILDRIQLVTQTSKSVPRLVAASRVVVGLGAAGYGAAWSVFTKFLCHPFPIVRKQASDAFYIWGIGVLDPSQALFEKDGGRLEDALMVVADSMNGIDDENIPQDVLKQLEQNFISSCPPAVSLGE